MSRTHRIQQTNVRNRLQGTALFLAGTGVTALCCLYIFTKIGTLSYRLVTVFLSLILISNLGAKCVSWYYKNKT